MRRRIGSLVLISLLPLAACQSSSDGGFTDNGGTASSTGGASPSTGGSVQTSAGATSSAGASGAGASSGMASGIGGTPGTGAAGASAGGVSAGGVSAGGVSAGGVSAGGVSAGGSSPGGAGAGGAPSTDICTRWKADRADLSEGTWSGDVASCNAGDLSANARANALRVVNLYRFLAGLPAVTTDPAFDAGDQACALMMRANNDLSHTPPSTWTCFTQQGADAAGSSNISGGQAVSSVDSYMIDDGNETTLGHRRWVLSNSLGPIGIGGTDKASCMHTLNGTGKAGKAWMSWPAPGTIPLQALNASRGRSVDITGWSIQSEKIDLSKAVVTVTMDGAMQPVTVTQLLANYGTKYAIDFIPQGWKTQAGKTYSVAVSGVTPAITYDVQIVDCK